jgi:WD40 repeat protein
VRNIDFNYTTSEIAVASADCTIRIFDIKKLQEKKILLAISFPQILCTSTLTENSF